MSDTRIKEAWNSLFPGEQFEILDGTVEEVDEEQFLIDIRLNGEEDSVILPGVTLRAAGDGTRPGFIQLPKLGSNVVFAKVAGASDYVLLKTTELDKVIIDVGIKIELNATETVFNSGKNAGIPISDKVTERLNGLENDINVLKKVLQSWIPVSQDGGAALKAAAASWFSSQLTLTDSTSIQNDKVKH